MMRKDHSWIIGMLLAPSLGMTSLWIGGCSSGQQRPGSKQTIDESYTTDLESLDTRARLTTLAERESKKPSTPARELVNRLMDGRLTQLRPGSNAYITAHRSLDEVLADVGGEVETADHGLVPLNPQIAKGYVRARSAMNNEDYDSAIGMFTQLHEASPDSPEILVGLGDAYLRSGDRAQASDAYLRAVDLGESATRVVVYGAMGIVDDRDRVIKLCSRVWSDVDRSDYAGRLLGGVLLGQALIESGSFTAGAEVMGSALEMLDAQVARDPVYRRELVQLYTKRAERYASMGDAWMLLDQGERASEAYATARSLLPAEPRELMFRRVGADLLSGHSAEAAMALLGWIEENPGNTTALLQQQVSIVGEHPLMGDLVYRSIWQQASDQGLTISHRESLLGILLAMRNDPGSMESALASVDPSIVSPVACARVLSVHADRSEKIQAARSIVEQSPATATVVVPAMVRVDGDAAQLHDAIEGDDETARLMRRLIRLELQRPDLSEEITEFSSYTLSKHSTISVIAMGRESALAARWEDAGLCYDECATRASSMNSAEWKFFIDSLITSNRSGEAFAYARDRAMGDGARSSDWLVFARAAQQRQDADAAIGALERAIDLDPYDESIYEQLISMRGPNGAAADTDALRTVTRSLGQRLPESALVRLIRAHELAGAGANGEQDGRAAVMIGQSERLLLDVHARHPWREIGTDLLLSIWATQASMGDSTALQRGLGWLDAQLTLMPGSVDLSSAMARLIVLSGDEIGAEGFLDELHQRIPSRNVGRLHEGLIRSDESRRIEADEIALDRLAGLVSVNDGLERLERAGSQGRMSEYSLDELIPSDDSWEYERGQGLRLARVLGAVIESDTDQATADLVLQLIDRARGQLGEDQNEGITAADALDQIEIVARPTESDFSMDSYEQLVRRLREDRGEGGNQILTIAMQSMLRGTDPSSTLELLGRLSIGNDGKLDPVLTADLASLVGQVGSSEDLSAAVQRFDDAGLLVEARDLIVGSLGTLNEGTLAEEENPDGVVADLVYSVAVIASFYDRTSDANEMYRLALSFDNQHAWANNDLGYRMVEDGGDLDEAIRLLEIAHASEPGTASITDSLAWARYAIGIFADELDANGQVVRRGARSLLEEAAELDHSNATIHDHLGDTLWMLGAFDLAIKSWLEAEDQLRKRLTEISDQQTNARAVNMLRDELSLIRFKITDAESGRTPKVTPNSAGIAIPQRDDKIDGLDPTK
jgi:tetratricopeptide (TPR) repeat protein